MLKRVLQDMGIEEERVRLEWISASEGEKVKLVINDMVEKVRALGPLESGRVQGRKRRACAEDGEAGRSCLAEAESRLLLVRLLRRLRRSRRGPGRGHPRRRRGRGHRLLARGHGLQAKDVEAMPDRSIVATLLNGAIRTSEQEEMAHLLRAKSQLLIAYGACAQLGGIPGLANQFDREQILHYVYEESPSTVNPEKTRPQRALPRQRPRAHPAGVLRHGPHARPGRRGGLLHSRLPADAEDPRSTPCRRCWQATLPPKGSVLAPDIALCDECPRKDTKPDGPGFHRVQAPAPDRRRSGEMSPGPGRRVHGAGDPRRVARRSACSGNMPCTGCFGPTSREGSGREDSVLALRPMSRPKRRRKSTASWPGSPIRWAPSTATACQERCCAGK